LHIPQKALKIFRRAFFPFIFHHWRKRYHDLLKQGKQGYRKTIVDIGCSEEQIIYIQEQMRLNKEVLVADIDQDENWISHIGTIDGFWDSPPDDFLPRKRHDVQVVAVNEIVGIKKNYRGKKMEFLNELRNLHHLGKANCAVPPIIEVDFEQLSITFSFIIGKSIRKLLAEHGAKILDSDMESNPENIDSGDGDEFRIHEAAKLLDSVLQYPIRVRVLEELRKIIDAGVIGNDVRYNNLIIEKDTNMPYWIDFEEPIQYPKWMRSLYKHLGNRDLEKYYHFFHNEN
jgi:hypothetical protein